MLLGVVGKSNVGKSTFFKAATLADVEIANYPFTTIKPNHGIGFVRIPCVDKEFNVQCKPRVGFCINHTRFVSIDLLDVAGLVPGAHEGHGMGNQFLNDLNMADVLIHVVDISGGTNEKGEEVPALSYDPLNDVKFLEEELDYWYLDILKKGWDKLARRIVQEKVESWKILGKQLSGVGADEKMVKIEIEKLKLNIGLPTEWRDEDLLKLASGIRKRTKPMIIAANKMDVPGTEENFERMKKEFPNYLIIPCSSESELALREASNHNLINYVPGNNDFEIMNPEKLNDRQRKGLEFIRNNVLKRFNNTGVQQVLNESVFNLLKYVAVYPVANSKLQDSSGNILPDVFLVKNNITAHEFAFKIHTTIGDNFIKAIDLKTKQVIGKEHHLKNLDVVEIVVKK